MAESGNLSALERAHKYHRAGKLVEAAEGYRKFLRKNPNHAPALYLLGCLEYQRGKNGEATDLLLEAVSLAPQEPEYHNALGLALTALDKQADAELQFRQALEIEPRASFYTNFALLRQKQKRLVEAAACLRAALALRPEDYELMCETGDLLQETEQFGAASELYAKAATLEPHLARAWYSRGCAENARQEFVTAAECFQKASDIEPDWLEARHNLARALYELGDVSQALGHFEKCGESASPAAVHSRAMAAVIVPGVPEADNRRILKIRRQFAARDLPPAPIAQSARPRNENEPLRVGYLSSFFPRDNWMKPVWGLINRHDRAALHVHLFSDAPESEVQQGYQPHLSDRFFDTSQLSTRALAQLIQETDLDLLVDLNGYSNMRRLPLYALRPARRVVGWFNLYATSGMDGFDYLIGDECVVAEGEDDAYSEKVLRVPGSYLTFSVDYPVPPVTDSPCLANGFITFGSLASQYKITPRVIELWAGILAAAPGSRLLLKNKHLASERTRAFVSERFGQWGITADRLILEGPEDHFAFLQAYGRIDLALDPFPYNGGTTTTEALWQGVPVIAFYGDRWAARTSASILRAGGLGEFVAADETGYRALAAQWAAQPEALQDWRKRMREQLRPSAVCDTERFAREMEKLYRQITLH